MERKDVIILTAGKPAYDQVRSIMEMNMSDDVDNKFHVYLRKENAEDCGSVSMRVSATSDGVRMFDGIQGVSVHDRL